MYKEIKTKMDKFGKKMKPKFWREADEDVKGLISNDMAKLLALIFVFIISYMVIAFFPQISQNYFFFMIQMLVSYVLPVIYYLTSIWLSPGGVGGIGFFFYLLFLLAIYAMFYYFFLGNYTLLINFAFFGYGLIISALVIITFLTLSSWVSFRYKIRRTRTQNSLKLTAETFGVAVGLFLLFFYLPYDIYLPSSILMKYTTWDLSLDVIFDPTNVVVTAMGLVGLETAGHILLRVFLIFFTAYGFIFLNDFVFWGYRKITKTKLIKLEPIYEYKAIDMKKTVEKLQKIGTELEKEKEKPKINEKKLKKLETEKEKLLRFYEMVKSV